MSSFSKIEKIVGKGITPVKDFRAEFCSKNRLGSGAYRDVYEFLPDPTMVVKIERDAKNIDFSNAREFLNYSYHRDWDALSVWLAPSWWICPSGMIMIQQRAEFRDKKHYPRMIPNILTDTKYKNYAWIGEQFVAIDYPSLLVGIEFRMKKAKWW